MVISPHQGRVTSLRTDTFPAGMVILLIGIRTSHPWLGRQSDDHGY